MKHIWIINSNSSTTVFYRNYSEMKVDPDLLSGLLTALNNFSAVELQSTGISSIEMGGMRWVYHQVPEMNLMLIAADDKSANSQVMRSRLQVIYKMFVDQFNITQERMQQELMNVKDFQDFGEVLDMLKSQWQQAESQFGPAQMFDILGIFQQIFNSMTEIVKTNFYGDDFDNIIQEIENLGDEFETDPNIKKNPEYQKIQFDRKHGWEVINMNPMNLEGESLKRVLFTILGRLKEILMKNMSKMSLLYAFNKYIYPLIINQHDMLDNLDIVPPILNMFLKN